MTDRPALHRAFDETAALYGRLDVVFANAGIDSGPGFVTLDRKTRVPEGAVENYDDARWNRVIETNLNSVFTTIKAAARHMKKRNSGRIIVTTFLSQRRRRWRSTPSSRGCSRSRRSTGSTTTWARSR